MKQKEISEAARALGRLGKGKPKRYTAAERARRRERLAEARKKRWQGLVRPELKQKIHDWNRIDQELETLWRDNDKPRGKAWKKVAAPLRAEQTRVVSDLAPLLLEWAEKNGCGEYRDGSGRLGLVAWWPKKDCYKNIVEHTGLKASPHEIRNLLLEGGWQVRGKQVDEQNRKNLDEFVRLRSMSDAEFDKYIDGYCTASIEGKNTKKFVLELPEHKKVEQQQSRIENQQANIAELKSTIVQQQKDFQATIAKLKETVTAQLKEQAAQR